MMQVTGLLQWLLTSATHQKIYNQSDGDEREGQQETKFTTSNISFGIFFDTLNYPYWLFTY